MRQLLLSSALSISLLSHPLSASAQTAIPPVSSIHAFFQAVDAGDLAGVQRYMENARALTQTGTLLGGSQPIYAVNLEIRDAAGNTPLIRSAMRPNMKVMEYLVKNGANINAENARWETPLIVSYNSGNFDAARFLLSQGANDPYQVAQRLKTLDVQKAAQTAAVSKGKVSTAMIGIGLAGAAGIGTAVALSGDDGGGGGDSSSSCDAGTGDHPLDCDPTEFETTEAAVQEGVLTMNAQYAYARGYDGRIYNRDSGGDLVDTTADGNVLVAVLDTGVDLDHPDLDANIRTDVSATCISSGCTAGAGDDTNGHGTRVTGILAAEKNGVEMHGVAYAAEIMAIGFANGSGTLTTGDVPGIQYAIDNGAQVINASYGWNYGDSTEIPIVTAGGQPALTPVQLRSDLTTTVSGSTYLSAFQDVAASDGIIVYAAGNDGMTEVGVLAGLPLYFQGATAPAGISQPNYDIVNVEHYDWTGHWVAAVSVDDSNVISSFSNRCGVAKNWCIAAPGEISKSTTLAGAYATNIAGTSYAAPNVTGAIAVMLGAFPHLDADEVLEILFDTATDLGTAGVDDVYGHGLVNLNAATEPTVGGWTLEVSGSSSRSFYNSRFGLSAPFGNALAQNHGNLIFLDAYRKDYTIPLSAVSGRLAQGRTLFDNYVRFSRDEYDNVVNFGEGKVSFTTAAVADQTGVADPNERMLHKASYQTLIPLGEDNASFAFYYKANLAEAAMDPVQRKLVTSQALRNPYISLADVASGTISSYEAGDAKVTMAAYAGRMEDEYEYRFSDSKKFSGVYSEYVQGGGGGTWQLALGQGVHIEQNSLLGSEMSGAFGIDKAVTYYGTLGARYKLARNMTLLGNYNMGVTSVSAGNSSLFSNFGNIMTSAFAAGAEWANVANDNDRLGLLVSQPLRVNSGRANLSLPVDVMRGGSVLYADSQLNLAPSGHELDLEMYYYLPVGKESELSFNSVLRSQPDNDSSAESEAAILTKYRQTF